jgi:hypothetical protein
MNFICHICNKEYSSYKSLWNHNNKFHLEQHLHINNNKERNFECDFCKKPFRTKQNMNIHIQKTCKYKIDKANLLEKQIVELQKEVNNLKLSNNINTTNNGIINTNSNNNNTNNILVINKIGTENIGELNDEEIKEIFNQKLESVFKFIQHLNFNSRLPSNHNFCSTSLDGSYLTIFNTDDSVQKKERKKYFFEDLLNRSVNKMEQLYKKNKTKFNKSKQKQIEDEMQTLKDIRDQDMNDKLLGEMLKKLNLLSYNYKQIVLDTWKNGNITGKKLIPKTFDEDLACVSDDDDIKDIDDIFVVPVKKTWNNCETDAYYKSSTPNLIVRKKCKPNLKTQKEFDV